MRRKHIAVVVALIALAIGFSCLSARDVSAMTEEDEKIVIGWPDWNEGGGIINVPQLSTDEECQFVSEPNDMDQYPYYATATTTSAFIITDIESSAYNKLTVRWSSVDGADGYLLYRKNGIGKFDTLKNLTGTTYYTNTVTSGVKNTYKVAAYRLENGNKVIIGETGEASGTALPAAPVFSSANMAAYNKIRLIWNKVNGCEGYVIYRSESKNGVYSVLKTVKQATATNYVNVVRDSKTYYYKIRAFVTVDGKKIYGNFSNTMTGNVISGPPKNFMFEKRTATKVYFSWDKVEDADGYVIYIYYPETEKYKAVKNITDTDVLTYTKKVAKDDNYSYAIRSYRLIDGVKVYSEYERYESDSHKHSLIETKKASATCTKEGNIAYWYCSGCKKYYSDANATKEISKEATIVPAAGHTPIVDPAVPATYDSTGLTEGSHCGVCGEVLVPQVTIPKLDGDTRHSISYDVANGDSYLAKQSIANSNPAYYVEGSVVQLKNISTPGYIFLGWYDGAGNDAVRIRKIDASSTDDYELYAHWQKITYKVQFVSNLYPIESIYYTVDTGAVLPSPTLSNYVFTGWIDDEGNIFKQTKIPVGTTGHMTLTANWMSERNKTVTFTNLSDPIIYEDEAEDRIYFAYEIGKVENVPLHIIKDFGYISGDGVTREETSTYSMTVSESLVEAYSRSLSQGTTESSNWTLSSGWTESTNIDKEWCDEHGVEYSEAETKGKTEEGNWLISNSKGGSYTQSHLNTDQSNRINEFKMSGSSTSSESSKIASSLKSELKTELKTEAKAGIGIGGLGESGNVSIGASASVSTGVSAMVGSEISAEESHSSSRTNGIEIGGSSSNTNITTDSASSTSSWNNSSSYGGSTSLSTNKTTAYGLAEKISEKTGYGKSYIIDGNQSNTAGTSHTQGTTEGYSTTTTYSKVTGNSVTSSWTTKDTKPGYHRWVVAGSMHVFGVVGYDMKTKAFFVDVFSIMDDYTYEFEDYSYNTANYNDNQTGLISFSVPTYVTEYVAEKTNYTEGLKIDQATGVITEYNGTDNGVFIPDYMPVYNYTASDGVKHYDIVKVTGIASDAFAGNENIVAVVLPDAVTEIPDGAFAGCTSLIGVVGGRGISVIGDNAFNGCTSIPCAAVHSNVTSLGANAFVGANKLLVNAANASVAEAALASGAKNIVLYTNHLDGGEAALNGKLLHIPQGTESVELNGNGMDDAAQTFTNIKIKSDAGKTVLNKMNLVSDTGVPLQISSSEVVLNQVGVTSNNIAIVLTANSVNLGLQGTVQMVSDTQNTMVSRDASLYESVSNAVGKLSLSGNMMVCGNVSKQELLARKGAEIKTITEDEFNKYVGGVVVIQLDVNGGNDLATTKIEAFRNCQVGTLPIPTREYYSFDGWYTAQAGGTLVTEASSLAQDIVLYAHWIARTYVISFNSNGGGGSYSPVTAYCDKAIGELPAPSRSLYTFDGWYTAATGGEKITRDTVKNKAENFTVYAHWIPNKHKVTFAPNGDGVTLSETSRTVTCDAAIGTLPTPKRDYYTFDGWYTQSSGGTKYTASTVVSIDADFTLYAHWTIHPLKDWTLASNVPSGAKIEQEKWTYTETSHKESTNASESGWTQYDSYWKQTGSGSKNYASFPSGFDKGHWIYTSFSKEPYESYNNGNTKRDVRNEWTGFVYWHWMYNVAYANVTNRAILDYRGIGTDGYAYYYFYAFTSATDCPYLDNYYCNNRNLPSYNCRNALPETGSIGIGSNRFFRFDYCTSYYTDYQKIYKHKKVENLESSTSISPSDSISNVQRWVKYRER